MKPTYNIDHAIPALKLTDEIHYALDLMDEHKVFHLPVVQEDQYLGYVSESILLDSSASTINEIVLAGEKAFTTDQESLYGSARKLAIYDLSTLAVLDKENKYLGIITIQSLFKSLREISAVRSSGGVFSIIVKQQDYSLSVLSRILESNGYKILSVELLTVPDNPLKLEVVFKVNSLDLSTAYSALERHGYTIQLKFGESIQDLDNQHRLGHLFNFLEL